MYEQFFGLRQRPFNLTPNPRYLLLTESHREVLANLEYGIASRKGIALLVGEAGSGKTTMIRAAINRQPIKVHFVHLHNPTLTRSEFVETLAAHFGLSAAASRSKAAMLLELERMLLARRDRGEATALVVDEAQSLPLELLEEIRLLANLETNLEKLMTVIIAGQPELADRLNEYQLRQLKQRIALRCELRPLSAMETAAYLAGRIRVAGGAGAQVFTREAVLRIHEHSEGIPRMVSVIADNALLGGFAAGKRPVGSDIVRDICRDFDFRPGSADPSRHAELRRLAERRSAGPLVRNGITHGNRFIAIPPKPAEEVVQETAKPAPPAPDSVLDDEDRELKEAFFSTYFEKVWVGPQ
jgi:general secretion pathway protein A